LESNLQPSDCKTTTLPTKPQLPLTQLHIKSDAVKTFQNICYKSFHCWVLAKMQFSQTLWLINITDTSNLTLLELSHCTKSNQDMSECLLVKRPVATSQHQSRKKTGY
ncbi:hypothetical protein AMECASPLE_038900, partial [Ameca splendens]